MKRYSVLLLLLIALFATDAAAQTGLYVGGHIRRERPATITKLKASGFRYVILFNVHVDPDGTLKTDGETICKNGKYVFHETQPHYVEDVKALKTFPTGIERIEICIGGWGNDSYNNIKELIKSQNTGTNSILYKNFKALKDAIPEIDAVNNDDEHCYDKTTALSFHKMMYRLGYKTTVAPYTNRDFWEYLATNLNRTYPQACDCVMIQCYDGGANNNPSDWHFGNIPLHAGRLNYQSSMTESVAQMGKWKNNCNVTGGFVWIYNDETWNLAEWALAMNKVFPKAVNDTAAIAYEKYGFSVRGEVTPLPEGQFCDANLSHYGIRPGGIHSIQLKQGYRLTLYKKDNCTGDSLVYEAGETGLGSLNTTTYKSMRIARAETDGIHATNGGGKPKTHVAIDKHVMRIQATPNTIVTLYNTQGQYVASAQTDAQGRAAFNLSGLSHGLYIVSDKHGSVKVSY